MAAGGGTLVKFNFKVSNSIVSNLVKSGMSDEVFDGNMTPLLELMNEDVLGFEVESYSDSGWSWEVKLSPPHRP